MYSQAVLVALFAALAEARFGQEQGNGAITAIGALTDLGSPGQAATLAGGSIQFLLAAANPCGKLTQADNIISELGTSDRAVAAARGLVQAEQNFNPFVVSVPSICSDPTLPKSAELRGVVPLIDPAVVGSDLENANANTSITTPFAADGLSVAQVMIAQGFSNFTAVAADGTKADASTLGGATSGATAEAADATVAVASSAVASSTAAAAVSSAAAASTDCAPSTTLVTVTRAAVATSSDCAAAVTVTVQASAAASASASASAVEVESSSVASSAASAATSSASTAAAGTCTGSGQTLVCTSPAVGAGAVSDPVTGTFGGFQASTIAGLDFGLCVPTMKFEAGLDGRASTASTFQAQDPLCNKGQEEALNPAIIANRIHDQLTNVCGANQAAKDAVAAAQTAISTLARDATTAQAWNTMLGFDGTNINPDNAPQTGLVGHV